MTGILFWFLPINSSLLSPYEEQLKMVMGEQSKWFLALAVEGPESKIYRFYGFHFVSKLRLSTKYLRAYIYFFLFI